jgi:RNA-directed DNA polymerase
MSRCREADRIPAGSETRRTLRTFRHENREIPEMPGGVVRSGRAVEGPPRTTVVHVSGKSDKGVVPMSHRRPSGRGQGEGRPETSGNPPGPSVTGAQNPEAAMSGLERIREAAKRHRTQRFTSVLHHITAGMLSEAYGALRRDAAPGVDGETWASYGDDLCAKLVDLHGRVQSGRYRPQPTKRAWIPKSDGRRRALGIAAVEDKIVQLAAVWVLQAIYEQDFAGFSYGFRPGRGQTHALDAIWVGLVERNVHWVLDADIRSFFDTIDHDWMMAFVEHRIADRRMLRLLRQWLRAGTVESGTWSETRIGTPQGAVISPLLANLYLHHVFDLWITWWRRQPGTGTVVVVRYADDFVVGFQRQDDAMRFLSDLRERMAKFRLELHADKTRLIEFGRFAMANRARRGERRPETFNFLGFTHRCAKRLKDGCFTVVRSTMTKRMGEAVRRIGARLMDMRSRPMHEQGTWLSAVVRGWLNYHAIPGNSLAINAFRCRVVEAWRRALRRRSQTAAYGLHWEAMRRIADRWIPPARILHPYPDQRLRVRT